LRSLWAITIWPTVIFMWAKGWQYHQNKICC
jgi:hypothetical protein